MNSTQVRLTNGARVYILDCVLDSETLAYTHRLADTFSTDNPLWTRAGTADNYPRWEYDITHATFDPVRRAFGSGKLLNHWQQQLVQEPGRELFMSNISFFVDLPGSPPLAPHVEGVDSWLAQVYIARKSHAYNGTTVYNAAKEILFQLPYRDNAGWLFDTAGQVPHGREHGVPQDLDRFSIMIWYALLPQ
jgi:hypothetical protein